MQGLGSYFEGKKLRNIVKIMSVNFLAKRSFHRSVRVANFGGKLLAKQKQL